MLTLEQYIKTYMEILIIIGLILLNGFFSMSEIAVVSARKAKLSSEAKQGSKAAQSALKLAEDPTKFLSTVQIGITLIGILTGIYSGAALADGFAVILESWGLASKYTHFVAQTTIVVVVTYLSIVFGELIPKRIGMNAASKVAKLIAKPMHILSLIASPFVWLLSQTTTFCSKLIGLTDSESQVTEEEIKSMIQEGFETGEVKEVEQDIVERVFSLGDRSIESIMTYRGEISWLDINRANADLYQYILDNPYKMYPVADKELDNILGIVSIKDLFGKMGNDNFDLKSVVKPALMLHEGMGVYKALEQMKENLSHYGVICDEFGSIQGIVTYKDILEGLVGELPEMNEEASIIQRQDGGWLVDGQCEFYSFLEYFDLEHLFQQNKYNTVSGLVIEKLDHIPRTGEKLEWNVLSIEIVDMDGVRIDKLLVNKITD